MRECAAEQRTSSWLRARVAKGLRAASLRQFRRANYPKRTNSRIKPDHHMLCRNFVCWLPKTGLLLWIFWAPRTEKGPFGYERLGAPSGKEVGEPVRKKVEIHYNLVASCSPNLHSDPTFSITLCSPLGPRTGSGAVPRTPALPGYCRGIAGTSSGHLRACARTCARAPACAPAGAHVSLSRRFLQSY